MSVHGEHIGDELLAKYLCGETTEQENEQVHQWVSQSDENNKHFYRFKTIWEESSYIGSTATVDENVAWDNFKKRTKQSATINLQPRYQWLKIAALLLILIGAGTFIYVLNADDAPTTQTTNIANPVNVKIPDTRQLYNNSPATNATLTSIQQTNKRNTINVPDELNSKQKNMKEIKVQGKFMNVAYEPALTTKHHGHTKKYVCNATPCPLEICIVQKVRCPGDHEPSAISTCSILAPDESGQLHYKSFEHITKNCDADVEEIRIKRVSTGETIVLDANSKPATARDFFSYITGEKKGDILAGMFHKDCNNHVDDCGLIYNTDFGSIIMQ